MGSTVLVGTESIGDCGNLALSYGGTVLNWVAAHCSPLCNANWPQVFLLISKNKQLFLAELVFIYFLLFIHKP